MRPATTEEAAAKYSSLNPLLTAYNNMVPATTEAAPNHSSIIRTKKLLRTKSTMTGLHTMENLHCNNSNLHFTLSQIIYKLIIKTTTALAELTTRTNNYYIISKRANIETPAQFKGPFSHPSTHEVTHLCQSRHEGIMSTPNHQQAQLIPVH